MRVDLVADQRTSRLVRGAQLQGRVAVGQVHEQGQLLDAAAPPADERRTQPGDQSCHHVRAIDAIGDQIRPVDRRHPPRLARSIVHAHHRAEDALIGNRIQDGVARRHRGPPQPQRDLVASHVFDPCQGSESRQQGLKDRVGESRTVIDAVPLRSTDKLRAHIEITRRDFVGAILVRQAHEQHLVVVALFDTGQNLLGLELLEAVDRRFSQGLRRRRGRKRPPRPHHGPRRALRAPPPGWPRYCHTARLGA